MAMNISALGNTYNGINTNSKQYKALKEKGWLSGIIQNEAMMSPEERIIYETFCGRDTIIIVQTMDLTGGEDLSIGSEISFAFGGNAVHVFNKETGENLEF